MTTTIETAGTVIASVPRPAWATETDHFYGSEIRHDRCIAVDSALMVYMSVRDSFEQRDDGAATIVRAAATITVSYDAPPAAVEVIELTIGQARTYDGRGAAQVRQLVAAYDEEGTE